ncbi:hypothetical protein [Streptomyces sp. NPDC059515]
MSALTDSLTAALITIALAAVVNRLLAAHDRYTRRKRAAARAARKEQ